MKRIKLERHFTGNWFHGNHYILCGANLAQYFEYPAEAEKIDILLSKRPLENGYEVYRLPTGDCEIATGAGVGEYQVLVNRAADIMEAFCGEDKIFYIALEYEE